LYRVENNQVGGKDFGYFLDTPDITIDSNIYAQIFALNCSNMNIANIDVNDVSFAVFIRDCMSPKITNCKFSYSFYPAVFLENCSSSHLTDNYFSNCEQGVSLYYSDDSILMYNTFIYQFFEALAIDRTNNVSITYNLFQEGNGGVELYQYTANNSIHHNTFQNCYAYDDGDSNTWYDPVAQEGNYWWDYSGSGNYTIWGSARANDTYPLNAPPVPIIPEFEDVFGFTYLLLLIPVIVLIPYMRKRKK
jgi:parallel beta-helix repeat protein